MLNTSSTDSNGDSAGAFHYLPFAGQENIQAAYRHLPACSELTVKARTENLAFIVQALETAGFVGIYLDVKDIDAGVFVATARKGRGGACYDTGRTARYTGCAAAVVDDDNHLLLGDKRICEKTAVLYTRTPYSKWIHVSPADPALLERLSHDPVPFDCDTLDADAARLAKQIPPSPAADTEKSVAVLYPGPFKLIILADGTIVRRGHAVRIPAHDVSAVQKEGAVVLDEHTGRNASAADHFADLYSQFGPAFVMSRMRFESRVHPKRSVHIRQLRSAPVSLKEKLRRVIERDDPYLILTGTDPGLPEGCCPSEEVGAANRLVAAGILTSWSPPAPPDACPSTVYAFNGEIQSSEGEPSFAVNRSFREQVLTQLNPPGGAAKRVLQLILTAFVAVTVGVAVLSTIAWQPHGKNASEPVDPTGVFADANGVAVYLVDSRQSCSYCRKLERYTAEALSTNFNRKMKRGSVVFRKVPASPLRSAGVFSDDRFVPANSLVLVNIAAGEVTAKQLLKGPWLLGSDGNRFKKQFTAELRSFLERNT